MKIKVKMKLMKMIHRLACKSRDNARVLRPVLREARGETPRGLLGKTAIVIARGLMALIYIVYGLNFFLHFIPAVLPPGKAGDFEGGLIRSDYFFQYMKAMQIAGSLLLFANRYTPLVLVVLFPITLNIFLFHIFLLSKGLYTAIVLMAANSFLLYAYRKYYRALWTSVATL